MKTENIFFKTSEAMIKEALLELYINPRDAVTKWSKITSQTCQIRFAYPGQHLASLITGIKGRGTAARGDDLADGSEVKTCSRADQLSLCKDCGEKVLVWQEECPSCRSHDINVKTDSHWIFSIKSETELDLLLNKIPHIILLLFDKETAKTDNIRFRAWTVNPKEQYVRDFFKDYFYNNFKKKRSPAPCNLHPLLFDFYKMLPSLIFQADMNIEDKKVDIKFWDLKKPQEWNMPTRLLSSVELKNIFPRALIEQKLKKLGKTVLDVRGLNRNELIALFPFISREKVRSLPMRKKVLKTYKNTYTRR